MNNEEAEVKVTQEIPLITGQYTSSTAAVNGTTSPFETIQREEVGTILKVTPHISEGDAIQLKIEQEDSSPGAKLADSADISTNKRSIKTTILIEDGGIIVLGGLMQDTVTESEDRVPVLGAIPLLGNLFKSRSGSRQKSNLLVFLRPKILRDQAATEAVSAAKYNEIREEERSLHKGKITLLPGEKQPSMPPMPQQAGRASERHEHRSSRRRRSPCRRAQPVRPGPRSCTAAATGAAGLAAGSRGAARAGRLRLRPPVRRRARAAAGTAAMSAELGTAGRAAETLLSVRQAPRRPGARASTDQLADTVCRPGRDPAGACRSAPLRRRAAEARARVGGEIRLAAAHRLRGGLGRDHADARGTGRQHRPGAPAPRTFPSPRTCSKATTRRRSSG